MPYFDVIKSSLTNTPQSVFDPKKEFKTLYQYLSKDFYEIHNEKLYEARQISNIRKQDFIINLLNNVNKGTDEYVVNQYDNNQKNNNEKKNKSRKQSNTQNDNLGIFDNKIGDDEEKDRIEREEREEREAKNLEVIIFLIYL